MWIWLGTWYFFFCSNTNGVKRHVMERFFVFVCVLLRVHNQQTQKTVFVDSRFLFQGLMKTAIESIMWSLKSNQLTEIWILGAIHTAAMDKLQQNFDLDIPWHHSKKIPGCFKIGKMTPNTSRSVCTGRRGDFSLVCLLEGGDLELGVQPPPQN